MANLTSSLVCDSYTNTNPFGLPANDSFLKISHRQPMTDLKFLVIALSNVSSTSLDPKPGQVFYSSPTVGASESIIFNADPSNIIDFQRFRLRKTLDLINSIVTSGGEHYPALISVSARKAASFVAFLPPSITTSPKVTIDDDADIVLSWRRTDPRETLSITFFSDECNPIATVVSDLPENEMARSFRFDRETPDWLAEKLTSFI
jgi:hypothetical protein